MVKITMQHFIEDEDALKKFLQACNNFKELCRIANEIVLNSGVKYTHNNRLKYSY